MIGAWACAAYVAIATVPLVRHDLRDHRLPNEWTMPGWGVAALAVLVQSLVSGRLVATPLLAAGCALVLFVLLAVVAGMGMGDVKLAVPLAAGLGFFGMPFVTLGLVIAIFSGGAVAVVLLVRGRAKDTEIAFGPCLLLGYWGAFVAGAVSGTAV